MIASLVSTIDDEPECVAKISPKHECHQKNKQIQNKRTSSCQIIAKDLHHLIFRQNYSKKNTFNVNDKIQFNVSDSIAFAPSPMIIIAPIKKNEKAEFYSALILRNKTDAIVKVFNGDNRVDAGEAEKRTLEKIQQKLLNSKFNKNFCHMLGFCFLENGDYALATEKGKTTVFEKMTKLEKKGKQMKFYKIKDFSLQMIRLFNSFQKIDLLYRDINPENIHIFKSEDGVITYKISDFEVAEWLDFEVKGSIFTKKLKLSGAPNWMSPENYSLYKRMKTNDENSSNDDSFNFTTKSRSEVRVDNERQNDNLILAMKKTFIQDETILITVNIEESYKSDVFSLGLMILAMALGLNHDLMKKVYNKNEKATKEAIKIFQKMEKPQNCKFLDSLIEIMLDFDVKERKDFKTIFKSLYNETLDENEEINENLNIRTIKTSKIENFPKFTESVLRRILEKGYIAEKLDQKFVTTILKNIWQKNAYDNFINKELSSFPNLLEIIKKNSGKFENLVKIYTSDLNFFRPLNEKLSKKEIDLCKFFVVSLLQERPRIKSQNFPKKVYRLIKSSKTDKNLINDYKKGVGQNFFWNSYSSTTKLKKIAKNWIDEEHSEYILFKIELDDSNYKNKIDISEISDYEEKEILLLPYFYFKVMKCSSFTVEVNGKKKEVLKICLKELKTQIFNFKIVWLDQNINSEDNIETQTKIQKQCGNLIPMKEVSQAIDYINNQKDLCIVISSGRMKEDFIDKIYNSEKVVYFLVYAAEKKKHEVWAKTKEKVVGVCEDEEELMEMLPKRKYLY